MTVCPFRVVDEINQGMDPVNERKVFMQLAEAACQPDTPQCFLLTPKLLPDLPFSDQVTLLSIFNGLLVNQVARGFTMVSALLVSGLSCRGLPTRNREERCICPWHLSVHRS